MKRRALFIVTSDPRQSGRAAEAVRIAAGVGAWPQVEVTIYLRGEAARALGRDAEELVDGENFHRYLPMLCERGQRILVENTAAAALAAGETLAPFESMDDSALAARLATNDCVLRF